MCVKKIESLFQTVSLTQTSSQCQIYLQKLLSKRTLDQTRREKDIVKLECSKIKLEEQLRKRQEKADRDIKKNREREKKEREKRVEQEEQKLEKLKMNREKTRLKNERMEIVREAIANRRKKNRLIAEALTIGEKQMLDERREEPDDADDFDDIIESVINNDQSVKFTSQVEEEAKADHMISIDFSCLGHAFVVVKFMGK